MRKEVEKLLDVYEKHGKIIVGCDFDDTFFMTSELHPDDFHTEPRTEKVRDLLRKAKPIMTLCLYTVSDPVSLLYKKEIMRLEGLEPDYVNSGPIDNQWDSTGKPYFNILLDDKAGLNEALSILEEFLSEVNK